MNLIPFQFENICTPKRDDRALGSFAINHDKGAGLRLNPRRQQAWGGRA